jgi:excisionase family DNA binding protein
MTARLTAMLPAEVSRPSIASEVAGLLEKAQTLPIEVVPALLGEVEHLRAALWSRLHAPSNPVPAADERADDDLLAPPEAAQLLGVTVRWLYAHQRELSFTRRLSRKTLRFSRRELHRWLGKRKV